MGCQSIPGLPPALSSPVLIHTPGWREPLWEWSVPGPLDPETSALTMKPLRVRVVAEFLIVFLVQKPSMIRKSNKTTCSFSFLDYFLLPTSFPGLFPCLIAFDKFSTTCLGSVFHTTPVRPTVHINPRRKRSFSKTLFKPEEFEHASFAF